MFIHQPPAISDELAALLGVIIPNEVPPSGLLPEHAPAARNSPQVKKHWCSQVEIGLASSACHMPAPVLGSDSIYYTDASMRRCVASSVEHSGRWTGREGQASRSRLLGLEET